MKNELYEFRYSPLVIGTKQAIRNCAEKRFVQNYYHGKETTLRYLAHLRDVYLNRSSLTNPHFFLEEIEELEKFYQSLTPLP